jgi:predicted nucleic acid-binding protein
MPESVFPVADYLVDTNILLRILTPEEPRIEAALQSLAVEGCGLLTTTQNFVETWNVLTRPLRQNGFGMSVSDAGGALQQLEALFVRLPDRDMVFAEWKRLVQHFKVSGVQVHDARLVALMKVHGIRHILTLNTSDFQRYASDGIVAVDPRQIP